MLLDREFTKLRKLGATYFSSAYPSRNLCKHQSALDIYTGIPYITFVIQSHVFEWDEAKALANLAKHGVPFEYAAAVFLDPLGIDFDASRPGDGELRRKFVGRIEGRLFTVVYTRRGDSLRLIFARRSNAREEQDYG